MLSCNIKSIKGLGEVNEKTLRLKFKMASNNERTYIMIKPDGIQRGLVGEIIKRFEQRGYHLAALKMIQVINEYHIIITKI